MRHPHRFASPLGVRAAAAVGVGAGLTATLAAGPLPDDLGTPWVEPTEAQLHVEVIDRPGGFDVVYTITNPTDHEIELPVLEIRDIELNPRAAEWLDPSDGSVRKPDRQRPGGPASTRCRTYPDDAYAPVVVARDDRAAVGFAAMYPLDDYRHGVTSCLRQPVTGSVWFYRLTLDGSILPGEERSYAVSARTAEPEAWLDTIAPYRRFLHDRYDTGEAAGARPVSAPGARYDVEHLRAPMTRPDEAVREPHQLAGYLVPNGEIRVAVAPGRNAPRRAAELSAWGVTVVTDD